MKTSALAQHAPVLGDDELQRTVERAKAGGREAFGRVYEQLAAQGTGPDRMPHVTRATAWERPGR